jgi:hypothetical protein
VASAAATFGDPERIRRLTEAFNGIAQGEA